jgi:DNA-binding GntR family transcriptional regulator
VLESHGVVTSERYKGIRRMPVTHERLEEVLEVRVALEGIAARRAIRDGHNTRAATRGLEAPVHELKLMCQRSQPYGFASADASFHRELCRLGGNSVVCTLWESLSRQLTIIFGLSTFGKLMPPSSRNIAC